MSDNQSSAETYTAPGTPAPEMFQPDGFPTRILMGMLFVAVGLLAFTVIALVEYVEVTAYAQKDELNDRADPELMRHHEMVTETLTSVGFAACPDEMADPNADPDAPVRSVTCKPGEARYHKPWEDALPEFLKKGGEALQPAAPPPGAQPVVPEQPVQGAAPPGTRANPRAHAGGIPPTMELDPAAAQKAAKTPAARDDARPPRGARPSAKNLQLPRGQFKNPRLAQPKLAR